MPYIKQQYPISKSWDITDTDTGIRFACVIDLSSPKIKGADNGYLLLRVSDRKLVEVGDEVAAEKTIDRWIFEAEQK